MLQMRRDRRRRTHSLQHIDIDLPPDLWREILARLPPKSVLRFRCVCKDWCSLIDDLDFISTHLNHSLNNSSAKTQLLVTEKVRNSRRYFNYTIRRSDNFRKIGQLVTTSAGCNYESCMIHGLKLKFMYLSDLFRIESILWNPSIRKSVTLPTCPLKDIFPYYRSFLGFAHSSADYKVVTFGHGYATGPTAAANYELAMAVYSLRDHRWSVNGVKVSKRCFEMIYYGQGAVYFQGALYWRPPCYKWGEKDTELFSFDFDSEEFSSLKLPDVEDKMYRFLFTFGESLAFFCMSEVRSWILIMEKNGGNDEHWRQCWDRETNVDFYKFFEVGTLQDCRIIYVQDTSTLLVQCFRKLIAYNMRTNQTHYLGKSVPFCDVETYVASLVFHKGYDGATSISAA